MGRERKALGVGGERWEAAQALMSSCPCLGLSGPLWTFLGLPGSSFAFLRLPEASWASLGLPGPSWALLGPPGPCVVEKERERERERDTERLCRLPFRETTTRYKSSSFACVISRRLRGGERSQSQA